MRELAEDPAPRFLRPCFLTLPLQTKSKTRRPACTHRHCTKSPLCFRRSTATHIGESRHSWLGTLRTFWRLSEARRSLAILLRRAPICTIPSRLLDVGFRQFRLPDIAQNDTGVLGQFLPQKQQRGLGLAAVLGSDFADPGRHTRASRGFRFYSRQLQQSRRNERCSRLRVSCELCAVHPGRGRR